MRPLTFYAPKNRNGKSSCWMTFLLGESNFRKKKKKKNPENKLPFPLNSVGVGGDEIQHQNMKNKNHPFQLLNITFDENYKRSSEIVVN